MSSPIGVIDDDLDAYKKKLQCVVCKRISEDVRFTPACLHCLCSGCASKLFDGKRSVACPSCGKRLRSEEELECPVWTRKWIGLLMASNTAGAPPDSSLNPECDDKVAPVNRHSSWARENIADAKQASVAVSELNLVCDLEASWDLKTMRQVKQNEKVSEWLQMVTVPGDNDWSSQSPADPYEFVSSQRAQGERQTESIPDYRPDTKRCSAVGDIAVEVNDDFDKIRLGVKSDGDFSSGSDDNWSPSKVARRDGPRLSYRGAKKRVAPRRESESSEEVAPQSKRKPGSRASKRSKMAAAEVSPGWGRAERVSKELKPKRPKRPALDVSYRRLATPTKQLDQSTTSNFNGFDAEQQEVSPKKKILDEFIQKESIEVSLEEESGHALELDLPESVRSKSGKCHAKRRSSETRARLPAAISDDSGVQADKTPDKQLSQADELPVEDQKGRGSKHTPVKRLSQAHALPVEDQNGRGSKHTPVKRLTQAHALPVEDQNGRGSKHTPVNRLSQAHALPVEDQNGRGSKHTPVNRLSQAHALPVEDQNGRGSKHTPVKRLSQARALPVEDQKGCGSKHTPVKRLSQARALPVEDQSGRENKQTPAKHVSEVRALFTEDETIPAGKQTPAKGVSEVRAPFTEDETIPAGKQTPAKRVSEVRALFTEDETIPAGKQTPAKRVSEVRAPFTEDETIPAGKQTPAKRVSEVRAPFTEDETIPAGKQTPAKRVSEVRALFTEDETIPAGKQTPAKRVSEVRALFTEDETIPADKQTPAKRVSEVRALFTEDETIPADKPTSQAEATTKRKTFSLGVNTQDLASCVNHSQETQDRLETVAPGPRRARTRAAPAVDLGADRSFFIVSSDTSTNLRVDCRIPGPIVGKIFEIMGRRMLAVTPEDAVVKALASVGVERVDAAVQTVDTKPSAFVPKKPSGLRCQADLSFVPVLTSDGLDEATSPQRRAMRRSERSDVMDRELEKVLANVRADLPKRVRGDSITDLCSDEDEQTRPVESSDVRFLYESSVGEGELSTQAVRRQEASITNLQGEINRLATGPVIRSESPVASDDDMDYIESTPRLAEQSSKSSECRPLCLAVSGLPPEAQMKVNALARVLNASVLDDPEEFSRLTHLIMKDSKRRRAHRTLKFVLAVAHKKWVVHTGWVDECLARGRLVAEDKYEMLDSAGGEGPCLSRTSPLLVFGHLKFQFHILDIGDPSAATLPLEDFKLVLRAAGARLCDSVQEFDGRKNCVVLTQGDDCGTDVRYTKEVLTLSCDWAIASVERFTLLPVYRFFPPGCEYSEPLLRKLQLLYPADMFEEEEEDVEDSEDEEEES